MPKSSGSNSPRFDHIQIEGEHGFGKPEERAYRHALDALGVTARDTWMVGDNLEWEVAAPQHLGIFAIWKDLLGDGLPAGTPIRPDRIIHSLTELLPAGRRMALLAVPSPACLGAKIPPHGASAVIGLS